MKFGILLLTFMCVMQQGALAGNEKQIKTYLGEWVKFERSLSNAPTLSHDGNTVYIYSFLPLEGVEVTVSDALGCIVYTATFSIGANQTVSFAFDDMGDGPYMIEVAHEGKYLYGWFEVLQ